MRGAPMKLTATWMIVVAVYLGAGLPLHASVGAGADGQTFITPRGDARNVRFEVRDKGVVSVFYDLVSSDPRGIFSVALEASEDDGTTFGVQPRTVTGDVGERISPGPGKQILWEFSKDIERADVGRFRFRIVAIGAPVKPEETEASVPGKTAAPTSPAPGEATKKGVNPLIWAGVAGGAAAAGLVAGSGGGGGTSSPSNVTPPPVTSVNRPPVISSVELRESSGAAVSTPVLIAQVTPISFYVTVSDPDGDALTFTLDYGEGTLESFSGLTPISGSTFRLKFERYYVGEGTFRPSVTATDSGGAASDRSMYPPVLVRTLTGNWRDNRTPSRLWTIFQFQTRVSASYFSTAGNSLNGQFVGGASPPRGVSFQDSLCFILLQASADLNTLTGTESCRGVVVNLTMTRQ